MYLCLIFSKILNVSFLIKDFIIILLLILFIICYLGPQWTHMLPKQHG